MFGPCLPVWTFLILLLCISTYDFPKYIFFYVDFENNSARIYIRTCILWWHGDLAINSEMFGKTDLPEQLKMIFTRYKRIGYNIGILLQTAC